MKKILKTFVTVVLLISMLSVNIYAMDLSLSIFTDVSGNEYYAEAAEELVSMGILNGYPDGSFRASSNITRAEMAVVICRLIGAEYYAKEAMGGTLFTDVISDHWASGYINIVHASGIASGDGDGTFRPEDNVKFEEAVKMIVCALGLDGEVEKYGSDWSKGYLDVAAQKGITANLIGKKGDFATRGDVAVMIFNVIEKPVENNEDALVVYGYTSASAPEKKEVFAKYQEKWAENAKEVGLEKIEWQSGDFEMLLNSGNYADVILKGVFSNNVQVAKYADMGILIDMAPYINETDTPNIWKMFTEHPTTKAIATAPDGGIYALPSYSGNPGSFIETYWYINDAWLKKLNLATPTNLDELYEVLKAFKNGDPNGNGIADEIPMTFKNDAAYSYPETLLSCWGVSTKFGAYDAYLNVQEGKVNFAPMMDEWKEMIRFYAKLNAEGLLDSQCFTYDSAQWSALVSGDTSKVGVTFMKENTFKNSAEYKVIPPLKSHADSPDPVMHIHPGVIGTRNAAHITNKCKDPATVMKWIDTFYDEEQTITNWYGEAGEGKYDSFTLVDGVYTWRDLNATGYETIRDMYSNNTTFGPHMLGHYDSDIRRGYADENGKFAEGVLIENCDAFSTYDENYALYEPYMDIRYSWPRPYYKLEDSIELSNMQADIFSFVEMNKVRWINGEGDIDAEWISYIEKLKLLNVDRFLEIQQDAYNTYEDVMKDLGM